MQLRPELRDDRGNGRRRAAQRQRSPRGARRAPRFAGRPLPGTELRIVDGDDHDVPTATVGEVLVRGPQLMGGYWSRPEDTAAALRDGWLHPGDAALMDEDGYLSIRDRGKDMIVSGGENVYRDVVETLSSSKQRSQTSR